MFSGFTLQSLSAIAYTEHRRRQLLFNPRATAVAATGTPAEMHRVSRDAEVGFASRNATRGMGFVIVLRLIARMLS